MNFNSDLAKTLFVYDSDDATEIEAALNNAVRPAKLQFQELLGLSEKIRYTNLTNPLTATSKDTDNITFNYDPNDFTIYENDYITLDSTVYQIIEAGSTTSDESYFVIDKEYSGAVLDFTLETLNDYETVFAYCVIYQFCNTGRKLFKDIILQNVEGYGEGTITPAYDPIAAYKKDLLKKIDSLLLSFQTIISSTKPKRRLIRG